MAKPILNEARAEHSLAETSIESNAKYELKEELLNELRSNTYRGKVEEDVVGHIAKFLKYSIQSNKFYLLSCASNYDKMCEDDEEGLDPLEFITWRNSKFKNHKKADETTKHTLLYSWIEVGNNEGLMDEDISSDDDKDQSNSSMITKPEIKIGDEILKILTLLMAWTKLTLPTALQNGDTEKWLSSEGTTTTWKKLVSKFFHKYYPLSHTYKSKIPDDLDHGTDYFEFLYWMASKFDNHWELDKNIKSGL
ncbi:hypothetical protein Tco_0941363 [Tanacetum coccineum]|uniref:Uncharacterized protein n=1 Tax=Tanacetum coccineum TaxID=301880 RepID=A0ABQ5DRI8_9ASTR